MTTDQPAPLAMSPDELSFDAFSAYVNAVAAHERETRLNDADNDDTLPRMTLRGVDTSGKLAYYLFMLPDIYSETADVPPSVHFANLGTEMGLGTLADGELVTLNSVVFVAEVWMATVSPGEMVNGRPVVAPRNNPKRREMLFCWGYHLPSKRWHTVAYEMIRDPERQVNGRPAVNDLVAEEHLTSATHSGVSAFLGGYDIGCLARTAGIDADAIREHIDQLVQLAARQAALDVASAAAATNKKSSSMRPPTHD